MSHNSMRYRATITIEYIYEPMLIALSISFPCTRHHVTRIKYNAGSRRIVRAIRPGLRPLAPTIHRPIYTRSAHWTHWHQFDARPNCLTYISLAHMINYSLYALLTTLKNLELFILRFLAYWFSSLNQYTTTLWLWSLNWLVLISNTIPYGLRWFGWLASGMESTV